MKGWLRLSLRAVNDANPYHKDFLPHREYRSTDVQPLKLDKVYTADVEIWPTNVVIEAGSVLELQIASCDTIGCGLFRHTDAEDRSETKLRGMNNVHLGPRWENYLQLPIIPPRS